jgi:hypothetical protein
MPPDMFPQTRALPTSQDLDRIFTNQLGFTSPSLQPQNFWERELAGSARGAGEASSFLAPRLPGYAAMPFTGPNALTRYGSLPINLATGTASGAAATATEQGVKQLGLDPDKAASLAPGLPVNAGMIAGLATGGAIQGVTGLVHQFTGNTPYNRVVRSFGGDVRTGEPFTTQAGADLAAEIRANGPSGTSLDRQTYNALTRRNVTGDTVYNRVLNDPHVAVTLRNEYPDAMDDLTGAHLANTTTRAGWLNLHPRVKESLIPDPTQRGIVEQTFRGGVAAPVSFLERAQAARDAADQFIKRGVGSEAIGAGLTYFSQMAHSDPSLAGGLSLLGATLPVIPAAYKAVMGSPIARQGMIGAAIGLGPGSDLAAPMTAVQ